MLLKGGKEPATEHERWYESSMTTFVVCSEPEGKIKELPLMSETTHILETLEKAGAFKIMEGNKTTKQYCCNPNNKRLQSVKA